MNEPLSKNIKFWDAFFRARQQEPQLNRLIAKISQEYWLDVLRKLVSAQGRGFRSLEIGSGRGDLSVGMSMIGYDCCLGDISEVALLLGKTNFQKISLSGSFILMDASMLPFKDETFDVVVSGGVVQHFEDINEFVREGSSVLKKGGLYAIFTGIKGFSIQTPVNAIAIAARILYYVLTLNIAKLKSFEFNLFHPAHYHYRNLDKLAKVLTDNNISVLVRTGINPYPYVPLPRYLENVYIYIIKLFMPLVKRFNASSSRMSSIVGTSYFICGYKR